MSFRTSRIFKALDKHDATTHQQIRQLMAAGDDAKMVDESTERGFIHKIVESFEAPQDDENLERDLLPCLIALVTAGANINLRDKDGNTPLHLAFMLNSGAKIVNMLVKLGADMTILNNTGQKIGDLINNSTDPRMVKAFGVILPGLWHAVESDDHEKVVSMLEKWCKIDITLDDLSLIDRAKAKGDKEIISTLQAFWPINQFIYAALQQDTKKMRNIMKKEKIDVNVKDTSVVDDEGKPAEITLLGECFMLSLFESAKFLLECGASVNEPIQIGEDKEPVFFHLMKNCPALMFTPQFTTALKKADTRLIKHFSVGVLYNGFTNSWPVDVVGSLLENGLNITARNEDGYTLRDNILVQVAFYPRRKRLEKLNYVDQHIIKLVEEGSLEKLQDLAYAGYTNLNIHDKKGKPTTYLANKAGHKDVGDWLERLGELMKLSASLLEYIKQGNLARAKDYLNNQTAFIKDRAGRSPLHMAVLLERRFVVKFILKSYPATVHIRDDNGRTALHYACALPDATDIEDALAQSGADDAAQDDYHKCPIDYKLNSKDNFIENERKKTCALNIYLLEVYLNFADGIIDDDFDLVRDTRDDLQTEVKMSDIIPNMYRTTTDKPPGLLQLCLDNRRENIARYLIKNGVDMWEDVTFGGQTLKFPVAVEKAKMVRLNDFLVKLRQENEADDAKFKEAEEVIRRSATWKNNDADEEYDDDEEDDDDVKKSKACTIL